MEVSGKKGASVRSVEQSASPEENEIFCQPCLEDDKYQTTYGYCCDCQEYLCKDCYTFHSKLKATKTHVFIKERDMAQGKPPPTKSDDVDDKLDGGDKMMATCPVHANKIIEFYCETDDSTACSVCVALDHRNCPDLKYIPDISKGVADSEELKAIETKSKKLLGRLSSIDVGSGKSIEVLKKAGSARSRAALKYRNELVEVIDKLVAKAELEKNAYTEKMTDQVKNARKLSKKQLDSLENVTSEISGRKQERQQNNLFVTMKQAKTLITRCEKSISKLENDINVKPCVFENNRKVYNMLSSVDSIVTIITSYPYLCDEINIQAPTDSKTCNVTAIHVLSDGRFVIADFDNNNVKLFNTNKSLRSEVTLPAGPWDIAAVNKAELVVTVPYKDIIQFLSISDDKLTAGRIRKTDASCSSVAVSGTKLITCTMFTADVVLRDMNGKRLRTVWTYTSDWAVCTRVHPDNTKLFVSHGNILTCVMLDGIVEWEYRGDSCDLLQGIATHTDGSVYVFNIHSNNVHHVTTDGQLIEILFRNNELEKPSSVCFDREYKLYVSEMETNTLKLFNLMD